MKKSITMSIIIVLLSTQLFLVVGATEIQESLQESQVLKEISDLRTSHSKTFLIDGKYTQEIFGEGIHFESIDGKFHDISTDLIDADNFELSQYSLEELVIDDSLVSKLETISLQGMKIAEKINKKKISKASSEMFVDLLTKKVTNKDAQNDPSFYTSFQLPYKLLISKDLLNGYSIGYKGQTLTIIPSNIISTIGKIDESQKNVIYYENLWPSTDLKLTVMPSGIKEEIILKDINAPEKFTFEIIGEVDESFRLGDLIISPSWLEDQSGLRRDVQMEIRREGEKKYLDLYWNNTGLIYPIVIDPSVSIGYSYRFYHCSNFENQNILQNGMVVGYRDWNECSSYLNFDTSNIPLNAKITGAQLKIPYYASGNFNVIARQMTTPVSTNINRPLNYTTENQVSELVYSTEGSKGNFAYWNVVNMVSNSFRNGVLKIGLFAEGLSQNVAMFSNDYYGFPSLSITYTTDIRNDYHYDKSNRLIYISKNNMIISFVYDDNGRLLRKENIPLEDNLITNGYFSIRGGNWEYDNHFDITTNIGGSNSLRFHRNIGSNYQSTAYSYPIRVDENSKYSISGKMMNNGLSGELYITWTEFNSYYGIVQSGTKLINSNNITNHGEWVSFEEIITTTILTQWLTIDIVASPSSYGNAYVSSLKMIPVQETEQLIDIIWILGQDSKIISDCRVEGINCIENYAGAYSDKLIMKSEKIYLEPGEYQLSFWEKSDLYQGSYSGYYIKGRNDGYEQGAYWISIGHSGGWTKKTEVINMDSSFDYIRFYFYTNDFSYGYSYFSEFKLSKISD